MERDRAQHRPGMIAANRADNLVVGCWMGAVPLGGIQPALPLAIEALEALWGSGQGALSDDGPAQLSPGVIDLPWTRFLVVQLPALRLALASAVLAAWVGRRLGLGEYGVRTRDTLHALLLARLALAEARESQ
jgi:hypothetical protein